MFRGRYGLAASDLTAQEMGGQRTVDTARQCDLKVDRSSSHNSWCRSIWTAVVLFEVAMGGFSNHVNQLENCFFFIRTRTGNG
jgi:hypothetical protein